MVIMYLGFLGPVVVAGYAVLIPLFTGIPMMLYYCKIEKFGMITITSVIFAILYSNRVDCPNGYYVSWILRTGCSCRIRNSYTFIYGNTNDALLLQN